MAPILSMLANTLFSIAADKAQNAVKDHIMKAINENLDDDAKKVLDQAISDDKGHNKNSLSDLLGGESRTISENRSLRRVLLP